jgi:hypothetical protein
MACSRMIKYPTYEEKGEKKKNETGLTPNQQQH